MAEVKLNCPNCEKVFALDDSLLGTTIHCPHCSEPVALPAPPKAAPVATFVQEPVVATPVTPEEEVEIFDIHPVVRGSVFRIVWNLLWIAAGIVAWRYLADLNSLGDIKGLDQLDLDLSKYELTPQAAYLGLVFSLFGLLGLLRVFLGAMFNRYRLTSERLFMRTGIIARHSEEIELFRIKDVSVHQGALHRILGAGHVTILSTDDSTPWVVLRTVSGPEQVKEQIRTASRAARKREGLRAAEFIQS